LVEPFADVFLHARRRSALDDVRTMSLIYHHVRHETSDRQQGSGAPDCSR
jgi:hypothetical protein